MRIKAGECHCKYKFRKSQEFVISLVSWIKGAIGFSSIFFGNYGAHRKSPINNYRRKMEFPTKMFFADFSFHFLDNEKKKD